MQILTDENKEDLVTASERSVQIDTFAVGLAIRPSLEIYLVPKTRV